MGVIEIIIVGISLSMDAFAASVCSGLKMAKIDYGKAVLISLFFGGFQALMPMLGWALGQFFAAYADRYDQYIAFGLLAFLGGKMLWDVLRGSGGESTAEMLDLRSVFVVAVATSVDALAVGVTFGMDPSVRIVPAALLIGATTFAICFAGVVIGNIFGARWQRKAQIAGGLMLIMVGLKILLEGIGLINIPL